MSKIVSIEGNIGSGKSTILKQLKDYLKDNKNIIFLQEPVEQWEKIRDKNDVSIISKFYANQEKYSFAFQMMAYISRLSMLKSKMEENPNSIIITERCLNTDRYVFAKMLYDSGKLEDVEYQIYLKWFDHFIDCQKIQQVVYLRTEPTICHHRINKRNRDGESNISIEYLDKCHKYHEDMIENNINGKLIIDSNIDTEENSHMINIWLKMIESFIIDNKN